MALRRLTRTDPMDDGTVAAYVSANFTTDMATGCQVWAGPVTEHTNKSNGLHFVWPVLGLPNRKNEQVRRWWWGYCNPDEDLTGYKVRRDTSGTCHPACINPEHMLVEPQTGWA